MSDGQPSPFLTRTHIFAAVFFALFIFLLYQAARLLAPFASALLWAAILTLAMYPLYRKILALVKGRAGLAAFIMALITLILIVGPAIALLAALTAQAVDLYQWAFEIIQSGRLAEAWSSLKTEFFDRILAHPALSGLDVKAIVIKGFGEISSRMAAHIGSALKDTALMTINVLIMLLSLFFFFRDGETYCNSIIDLLPFTSEQKQVIMQKFSNTFTAVINGVFFIALIQGLMTGIGFALFSIPFAVFWGFLAAVLALLPIGGATLVWLPGALYLFLTGETARGIFLAVWGLLLVSLPDNFLKPVLIGRKAKLPTFFLFIGILGGLKVYGILGILFGPVIVTLVTVFVQIYREEFANR